MRPKIRIVEEIRQMHTYCKITYGVLGQLAELKRCPPFEDISTYHATSYIATAHINQKRLAI